MQQSEGGNAQLPVEAVARIVSAYVGNHRVDPADLPGLINTVATEMKRISFGEIVAPEAEKSAPAVSIRKSITPDYIIDLFTGKRFKSLKRHLRTNHNMTPEQYRAYWDLPKDYPMVAPNYAKARSDLAKQMGLGQGGRQPPKAAAAPAAPKAPKAAAAKKAAAPKASKAKAAAAPKAAAPAPAEPATAEA